MNETLKWTNTRVPPFFSTIFPVFLIGGKSAADSLSSRKDFNEFIVDHWDLLVDPFTGFWMIFHWWWCCFLFHSAQIQFSQQNRPGLVFLLRNHSISIWIFCNWNRKITWPITNLIIPQILDSDWLTDIRDFHLETCMCYYWSNTHQLTVDETVHAVTSADELRHHSFSLLLQLFSAIIFFFHVIETVRLLLLLVNNQTFIIYIYKWIERQNWDRMFRIVLL